MLQFATAIHQISSAYLRSCFPTFQSAYVRDDKQTQKAVVERGISCYVCMYIVATVLVTACLPILTLFKHDFICDPVLFLGIALYYFLLNQHSLFCNIIVSMNEIPYFKAYLVSTAAGICVSCVLCGALSWGAWGLVVGQAIPQLCYNNWHWPQYVLKRTGLGYVQAINSGFDWWKKRMVGKRA